MGGRGSANIVVRSWKSCAFWFVFSAVPASFIALEVESEQSQRNLKLSVVLGLVTLFGIQGFLAEMAGMRGDQNGFSFPRRLFPRLGFPVLWRRKIRGNRISRIDTLDPKTLRFYSKSGNRLDLVFANRQKRLEFLGFARRAYLGGARTRTGMSHSMLKEDGRPHTTAQESAIERRAVRPRGGVRPGDFQDGA
jgi:hypothetical protein